MNNLSVENQLAIAQGRIKYLEKELSTTAEPKQPVQSVDVERELVQRFKVVWEDERHNPDLSFKDLDWFHAFGEWISQRYHLTPKEVE